MASGHATLASPATVTGPAANSRCFMKHLTQTTATRPKTTITLPLYNTMDRVIAGSGELFAIT